MESSGCWSRGVLRRVAVRLFRAPLEEAAVVLTSQQRREFTASREFLPALQSVAFWAPLETEKAATGGLPPPFSLLV